jgi:hypothetical protein
MTGVAKRTKGAGVFTMCEFDRLVVSMGAGTLRKYGRNGTILRAPSMRCDGTGRDGTAMVEGSMMMVDGSLAMADGSTTMMAALLSKHLTLLGSTESKHPYE